MSERLSSLFAGVVLVGAAAALFVPDAVSVNDRATHTRQAPSTLSVGGVITQGVMPRCDTGWTLVLRSDGKPACAKELKEPR